MGKVLLLNGSPRGRASRPEVRRGFRRRLSGLRGSRARENRPRRERHRPLHGLLWLLKGGKGACVRNDDMAELLPAYARADLVLVSTPVYHFGMTAMLKTFFERSLPLLYPYMVKAGPRYEHPERVALNPKQAVGLFSTCGFPDADNFRVLKAHFEKLLGGRLRFEFLCPEGELLMVPQMREAAAPRLAALKEAGATFARTGAVPSSTEAAVASPMVAEATFARLANSSWSVPGELPPSEAAFAGLEPYDPAPAAAAIGGAAPKGPSPALALLAQMKAVFDPKVASGLEAIIEFDFTDLREIYCFKIAGGESPSRPARRRRRPRRSSCPSRPGRGYLKGN